MSLYSKEELDYERSIGLELSDYENEHFYDDDEDSGDTYHWTNEEFEQWLSTKDWSEDNKEYHRRSFKGTITFGNGSFSYD